MTAADILGGLLRMNLAAGVAILIVIALRKLVRPRFGARLAYGLWLLPVLAGAAVLLPARQVLIVETAAPMVATASRLHRAFLASPGADALGLDPRALLVGLWLVGALGAALIMVWLQHRFMRQARGGAIGPAVVGVITPRILTPKDFAERYSQGEQALVLAHERAHIARQDSRLNGLSAAAQCLCWFNPLVHLAARLMRIDQELACDEAVVSRFPGARRAYAEVLMKAQLSIPPLPLGCYWPTKTKHPLVERVAMLRRKHIGHARRSAGVAALVGLCAGTGLAAWAARPADVRIAFRPAEEAQAARLAQAPAAAPQPVRAVAAKSLLDPAPPEAAAPTTTLANNEARLTRDLAAAETDAATSPPGQDVTPPQPAPPQPAADIAGPLRLIDLQTRPPGHDVSADPGLTTRQQTSPTAAPAIARISQKSGLAYDPEEMLCKVEAVTGSRFIRRICMTRSEWRQQQYQLFALERSMSLDPSGYSAGED